MAALEVESLRLPVIAEEEELGEGGTLRGFFTVDTLTR